MKLFMVRDSDKKIEQPVFEKSFDEAAAQFITDLVAFDMEVGHFEIEELHPSQMKKRERQHALAAIELSMVGMGRYDPVEGWKIRPAGTVRPGTSGLDEDDDGSGFPG